MSAAFCSKSDSKSFEVLLRSRKCTLASAIPSFGLRDVSPHLSPAFELHEKLALADRVASETRIRSTLPITLPAMFASSRLDRREY